MTKDSSVMLKQSVKIRLKPLARGRYSIYLDIYSRGRRSYEFLKLYLTPGEEENNAEAMAQAKSIRKLRLAEISSREGHERAVRAFVGNMKSDTTPQSAAKCAPLACTSSGGGKTAKIRAASAERKRNSRLKEPVKIRFKNLSNGNLSIYLAINVNGKRTYEYLRLYLVPEINAAAREQNRQTMDAVYTIKARRIMDITGRVAGIRNDIRAKMSLIDWLNIYRDRQIGRGRGGAKRWVQTTIFALRHYEAGKNAALNEIDRRWLSGFMLYLMNDYRTSKDTQLAKGTVDNYLRCLRAALNVAVEEEILRVNPISGFDRSHLKGASYPREFLTVDEVRKLIDTPCRRQAVKDGFLFSCFCGLRISDVRGLKWKNVIESGGKSYIYITQFKSKQPLFLPLNKQALRWMPERGGARDDDPVFCRLPKDMTVLNSWAQDAGIKKHVTFHVSRHTFATMALTMGADLYTTSKLLGHTEIRTTQIYARIVNSKKEKAVSLLDAAFE